MGEPIYSEDGKWMWTGSEWIPAPPKEPNSSNQMNSVFQESLYEEPLHNLHRGVNQQEVIFFPSTTENSTNLPVLITIFSVSFMLIVAGIAIAIFVGANEVQSKNVQVQSKNVQVSYFVTCSCEKVMIDIEYPDGTSSSWTETLTDEDGDGNTDPWSYDVNITMFPGDSVYISMMTQDRADDGDEEHFLGASIGANNRLIDGGTEIDQIATVYVLGLVTYEEHGDWLDSENSND
jgi:hypothetical protein